MSISIAQILNAFKWSVLFFAFTLSSLQVFFLCLSFNDAVSIETI
jgi:hypothetical protein